MDRISVLLAGDQILVRDGLKALLESQKDIEVVGETEPGPQAVQLAMKFMPDIVVMDMNKLPVECLESTRQITSGLPDTKVLGLSSESRGELNELMDRAGACGLLAIHSDAEAFLALIRRLYRSHTLQKLADDRADGPLNGYNRINGNGHHHASSHLTNRELKVLQLIALSFANKQIAHELGISIKTVEKHRQHAMNKLHIHDTAGLTRYAIAVGLVEPDVTTNGSPWIDLRCVA